MERAKKDMYLRIKEPEHDDRVFSGDNPDEVKAFFKEMANDEANRKQANEQSITNFESDLREYDRMIVEEMKTISQAQRIKQLLLGRLHVIEEFSTTDEYKKRYDEAIGLCKLLIEKVNCALGYLPDKEAALPFLTRVLTQREQQFLFDRLTKKQFISGDYESFCFAFGGTKTDNFRPIIWLKNNKQSLRDLLKELKPSNLTITETMKNAELYFTDAKGNKLCLPKKDRKHEENYDENLMSKTITEFRRL